MHAIHFPPLSQPRSKVLLLGSTGYIGSRLAALFRERGIKYVGLKSSDTGTASNLRAICQVQGITHILNAAGYTGRPNVDGCEEHKEECFAGNVLLPLTLRQVAESLHLPLIHLSSGCVFFRGDNLPTDATPDNYATFYTKCKIMAEELIGDYPLAAIVRLRMPFDSNNEARNYLTKILAYDSLIDFSNSLTFVSDLLESVINIESGGIFHAVNPGGVKASEVISLFSKYGIEKKPYSFLPNDTPLAARRSNVTLVPSFDVPHVLNRIEEVLTLWRGNEAKGSK